MSGLTYQIANEYLAYNPETGQILRRKKTSRKTKEGQDACGMHSSGYLRVTVLGERELAHRVAWLLYYGEWPKDKIDHRNGNRKDNRIANLREASTAENNQNMAGWRRSSSRFVGVSWDGSRLKWKAAITSGLKYKFLGRYDTEEEAHAAYCNAKAAMHYFQPVPREQMA